MNVFTKVFFITTAFLLLSSNGVSAADDYFFYIRFTDKNNSPFSLEHPEAFLSSRAIARRMRLNIPYEVSDLPVNPHYLAAIEDKGLQIHSTTKWLNGATVTTSDSMLIASLEELPFVDGVQYTGKIEHRPSGQQKKMPVMLQNVADDGDSPEKQLSQLKGNVLHQDNYHGNNIHIGVLDAGFYHMDANPAFVHLYESGRVAGVKNVVLPGENVYEADTHGANVMSIMAGDLDDSYQGSATAATYWLIQTEYSDVELLMEVDCWVAGIEYADSAGVDLINSSLGYTTFDNASANFTYNDMDGKTSRASIAAGIAAKKGILVVNSVGNDGNKSWKYVGVPADADGILTVGSVDAVGAVSDFSSFGPTSDGRVKPEICARGMRTFYVNFSGNVSTGSGTSYSTPIVTGLCACLLEACIDKGIELSVRGIIDLIVESASLYGNPDSRLGYGIPDFEQVYRRFVGTDIPPLRRDEQTRVWTETDKIYLKRTDDLPIKNIRIYSAMGALVLQNDLNELYAVLNTGRLGAGIYTLLLSTDYHKEIHKIVLP
ncbi:MAG: S8 family peptidase [Prevotellaceae bacterium]|jgi:hypothetical protein|nr:S8 family peptidase [Prevotellaceae bacterium]